MVPNEAVPSLFEALVRCCTRDGGTLSGNAAMAPPHEVKVVLNQ